MRVTSPKGQPKILNRPLQHIYPLEVRCEPIEGETGDKTHDELDHAAPAPKETSELSVPRRSTRNAAAQARDKILGCTISWSSD